jgi:hypothetical protein
MSAVNIEDADNEVELAEALFERLVQDFFYDSRELTERERKDAITLILRAIKYSRTQP